MLGWVGRVVCAGGSNGLVMVSTNALFWGVCVGSGSWKYFGGWLTRVFLTWNVKFCGDELFPLFSCNGVVVWREGFFFHEYCCQKNPHMKSGKSLV